MSTNYNLKYPFRVKGEEVKREWLDNNGHMNVAWYIATASDASFALLEAIGVDDQYRAQRQASFFTLETQIRYLQEIHAGAQLTFEARILNSNGKLFHTLWLHYAQNKAQNKNTLNKNTLDNNAPIYLAAMSEWIYAHVDLNKRKVKPYPDDVAKKIDDNKLACSSLKPIERQGETLGLNKK